MLINYRANNKKFISCPYHIILLGWRNVLTGHYLCQSFQGLHALFLLTKLLYIYIYISCKLHASVEQNRAVVMQRGCVLILSMQAFYYLLDTRLQ